LWRRKPLTVVTTTDRQEQHVEVEDVGKVEGDGD
jgi:hypothetical protein